MKKRTHARRNLSVFLEVSECLRLLATCWAVSLERVMRLLPIATLFVFSCDVVADCRPLMALDGVVSLDRCTDGPTCVSANEALYQYSGRIKGNDDPAILNITLHASPWRLYDREMRILTIEELADVVRPHIANGVKRVVIMGSWTGVSPSDHEESLVQKLSRSLGGFPVEGFDGFLWITSEGVTRTTHQAFTVWQGGGPYKIQQDAEVMVSMVAGWPATVSEVFLQEKNAEGLMRAAAGWDIFFLCPDHALEAFEVAARHSNSIAAYNAALIRLDRDSKGDR